MSNAVNSRIPNRSSLLLIITDLFSFCVSYALAILIRTIFNSLVNRPLEPLAGYWALILINILTLILIFGFMGLYRGYGLVAVVELRSITRSLFIGYIILAFFAYLIGQGARLSRIVFVLSLLFMFILVPLFRFIVYYYFSGFKSWGINVAVIAADEEYKNIISRLRNNRRLGFNPVMILRTNHTLEGESWFEGIPILDFSLEHMKKIQAEGIQFAFYTSNDLSDKDPILIEITRVFPVVYYVLPESNLSSLWIEVTDLLGRPALKVSYHLLNSTSNLVKRTIEVIGALFSLLITLPLTLVISLIIYLNDHGSIFYTQERLGKDGKPFRLIKFRTMVMNAEAVLEKYLEENSEARFEYEKYHKLKNDPRITRIGSILRKYSLDEIPQLINVVRGDMNLVGPRAYMVHELNIQDEVTQTILRVRPGVTGWWQVMGRHDTTFSDRQKLDLYYITNWSLWVDYYILIKTVWIILSGQGK